MDPKINKILTLNKMKNNINEHIQFYCHCISRTKELLKPYEKNEIYIDTPVEYDYFSLYSESRLRKKIDELHSIFEKIDNTIYGLCNHDFVDDYVEDLFGNAKHIKYCAICALHKRE